jgi:hypothetical protein
MVHRHPNYEEIVKSITQNMLEFGYEGLLESRVLQSYDKAMLGEEPTNIIDRMTRSMLEKNNLMPKIEGIDGG